MAQTERVGLAPRPLTEALARKAGDVALAKAAELGTTMSVAVVDGSGQLVYFVRGDGTGFHTLESSRGKAATSAAFRWPTAEMGELFQKHPGFFASLGNLGLVPIGGGVPLTQDGLLIGAVGCGGGSAENDEICAQAGAAAINT